MAKQYEGNSVPLENPLHVDAPCPQCGGEIVENYRRFACTTPGCEFSIAKHPSGPMLEPTEVEELISTGHVWDHFRGSLVNEASHLKPS